MENRKLFAQLAYTAILVLFASCSNSNEPSNAEGSLETENGLDSQQSQTYERTIHSAPLTDARFFGGESSGGGTGIHCEDSGSITVETLDSYEGKVLHNLDIEESPDDYRQQIERIITDRLSQVIGLDIDFRAVLGPIIENSEMLETGISINLPNDLGSDRAVVFPTGCTHIAIGYYQNNDKLVIASEYFQHLSETQKAMFFTHEALYVLDRYFNDRFSSKADQVHDSKATRNLVAHLFAKEMPDQQKFSELTASFRWHSPFTEPLLIAGTNGETKVNLEIESIWIGEAPAKASSQVAFESIVTCHLSPSFTDFEVSKHVPWNLRLDEQVEPKTSIELVFPEGCLAISWENFSSLSSSYLKVEFEGKVSVNDKEVLSVRNKSVNIPLYFKNES